MCFCIKDGVFIDPPYNTGNDFVYADYFADPLARYREVTQQTTKSNPESMGRFHTKWTRTVSSGFTLCWKPKALRTSVN
jgi:hypothetical protein